MAQGTVYASKAFIPRFMPVTGAAYVFQDVAVTTTALAAGDVLKYRLPAGVEVTHVQVRPDDLDSATAITFSTGYEPVEPNSGVGTGTNTTYFAGSKTSMQSGSVLDCNFAPKKFDEDMWVTLTILVTATTPVAGNVYVLVTANCQGPK